MECAHVAVSRLSRQPVVVRHGFGFIDCPQVRGIETLASAGMLEHRDTNQFGIGILGGIRASCARLRCDIALAGTSSSTRRNPKASTAPLGLVWVLALRHRSATWRSAEASAPGAPGLCCSAFGLSLRPQVRSSPSCWTPTRLGRWELLGMRSKWQHQRLGWHAPSTGHTPI